jgi:hypothetical protein
MQTAKVYLKEKVIGDAAMEDYVVRLWHYTMTVASHADGERQLREPTLYQLIAARNVTAILELPDLLTLLQQYDVFKMFYDVDITLEDKEQALDHLLLINATCIIYVSIPEDMYASLLEVFGDVDSGGEVSPERLAELVQRVIGKNMERFMSGDMDAVTRLTAWTQHIAYSPLMSQFKAGHISIFTELLPKFAAVAQMDPRIPAEVSALFTGVVDFLPTVNHLVQSGGDAGMGAGVGAGAGVGVGVDD